MMRAYKLRRAKQSDSVTSYSLAVPPEVARAISTETRFLCELTEEGILYRPVRPEEVVDTVAVPAWASEGGYADPDEEELDGNTPAERALQGSGYG
jgi:hypothetical protein